MHDVPIKAGDEIRGWDPRVQGNGTRAGTALVPDETILYSPLTCYIVLCYAIL